MGLSREFAARRTLLNRDVSRSQNPGSRYIGGPDRHRDAENGLSIAVEFIAQAKQRDHSQSICFDVQDATDLDYEDASFDQILYLQQIISLIDGAMARTNALKEAYRILSKGGVALFSFLYFERRLQSRFYSLFLNYLKNLRRWSGSNHLIQDLPWLKHGGKPNFSALLDREPYVYWYRLAEAVQHFKGGWVSNRWSGF